MPVVAPHAWRVPSLSREVGQPDTLLVARAAEALGIGQSDVLSWRISRRSIDARGRRAPRVVVSLDVEISPEAAPRVRASAGGAAPVPAPALREVRRVSSDAARPVIVGMGPAGLFAALQLAEAGLRPIVLDRGRAVEERAHDVSRLMRHGELDPESNLCFGEGGAGTWSDGKLYTRVGGPRVREVLEALVRLGGPEAILVDARPHLGTDRLVSLLKRFRAALRELGCELRFGARVSGISSRAGKVSGVELADGERIDATHVILAAGHSAREFYTGLGAIGVPMAPKAWAVGFRVEHPQPLIDEIQYGEWAGHPELPAAHYELSATLETPGGPRGVFSFCMCPGGSIVPTATREGEVCVNGMSHAARSGKYANSALVVSVEPGDWIAAPGADPLLGGLQFQEEAERAAWTLGGGAFVAPAQRLVDYLAGRPSASVRRTSYRRGVVPADLRACYPPRIHAALAEGIRLFERRMRGYLSEEAVLVGVETRTSAPVTVLRDRDTLESPGVARLYPCGEGAGHAGGIVSAAIDGIRVATSILDSLGGSVPPL